MTYPPQQPPHWQQQPPYQGQPYPGPPPQQPPPGYRPPPRRRHTARNVLLICAGALAVIVAVVAAGQGGKKPAAAAGAVAKVSSPQASAPSSPRHAARPARQTVTYQVHGSPADVSYGPSGSSLNGSVPMHVTKRLGDPSYYAISAQLNGGGKVTCKIKVDGKVVSSATASGGYNIASCEISQDPISGRWQNDN
jgi:hypothetical protein